MRRRKKPSTGYNSTPKRRPKAKLWTLHIADHFFHGSLAVVVKCNDVARGLLQLEDEDEFEWLKTRFDGTQLPKIK